jgi:hypothetical protein
MKIKIDKDLTLISVNFEKEEAVVRFWPQPRKKVKTSVTMPAEDLTIPFKRLSKKFIDWARDAKRIEK